MYIETGLINNISRVTAAYQSQLQVLVDRTTIFYRISRKCLDKINRFSSNRSAIYIRGDKRVNKNLSYSI